MSITYNVKAAIVNESISVIERFAAKITQVTKNCEEDYIKTFPLQTHRKNLTILSTIMQDLPPFKKAAFLGISFISYGYINFIHFTSSFKLFQLEKDDQIIFYFEDGESMEFTFHAPKTTVGFVNKNVHPIKDADLHMLKDKTLDHWKIVNKQNRLHIVGGFTFNEYNKQYKSTKIGQKLFRLMATNILVEKEKLSKS